MRGRPMDQRGYRGRGERFGPAPNDRENLGNRPSGKSDPKAYLSWECSCERIFQVNDITEEKKSFYAIAHFEGYANTWCDYVKRFGNMLNEGQPSPWDALKVFMRQRWGHKANECPNCRNVILREGKLHHLGEDVGLEDENDEKA
ncbi:hypothetical protein BC332_10629 [Capsicum chinense]|nr:hypothetical protein BC332_10629 [Capsicum chinense]